MVWKSVWRSAGHRQAARGADDLPGDEGGLVAGEEGDDAGEILRLAQAAERDRLGERALQLLALLAFAGEVAEQRGVGRAGADDVHVDLLARQFARHGLREGHQPALAEGIDRLARGADAGGVRGDVDDAPGAARG